MAHVRVEQSRPHQELKEAHCLMEAKDCLKGEVHPRVQSQPKPRQCLSPIQALFSRFMLVYEVLCWPSAWGWISPPPLEGRDMGVGGDMYSLPKLKWGWPRAIVMSSPPHLRELTLLTAPDSHRPYPQISTTLADIFKSDQWCVVPQFLIIQPEGL